MKMLIHAFCIVFLVCAIQSCTTAMSRSRYYLLSRDRAIVRHQEKMVARRSRMVVRQEQRVRILPFSEIDVRFVEQDIPVTDRHSCPSLSDFINNTSIRMCPNSLILDVDVNRLPVALYQVQCRCLHCLGPWSDYSKRRCTPLFKFLNVLRVVRRSAEKNIYAQVWEPVSYACTCAERIKGRTRYVTPP
ncbi:uncharacterized protein LOC123533936 [Mercenaria mercenaria]|uniref:uncharacterized protein LOC123533936 n=1 Tax=Mercenaria mercenaria TaxID=6596 RepID=UPI00234F6065|nr:uncharacterized protein LOC123533936 [Mercenaria mercenaria]